MDPALFLADLHRKPAALRDLAARLRNEDPWAFLSPDIDSVVLLGMGSSTYAGGVAAARLRARGVRAVSELASSDLQPRWGSDTVVLAISASGGSRETLAALDEFGDSTVVALTNTHASELAERAAHVVHMTAGAEEGGVACRSFQHTLVLLAALEAHLTRRPIAPLADLVEKAADASDHLLSMSDAWLPGVADLVAGPDGTHLAAPARRISSAQQGALMLREGPRRPAVACEAGDWAHVDVYLTKNTDYRLLLFTGSRWEDGILEWTRPRGTTVVAVGGDFPDADLTVRYPYDDIDDVRLLTETLVPELVAARLWSSSTDGFQQVWEQPRR